MAELIDELDATPPKRIFLSIIADYGIRSGLCELIDNAIDSWVIAGENGTLDIRVSLDVNQQTIAVEDNAGGLEEKNMVWIVGPGHTGNNPDGDSIGFFGVGTKRAVVAIAGDTAIYSCATGEKGCMARVDDDWLQEESWKLNLYRSQAIEEGNTRVVLSKLRRPIDENTSKFAKERFASTYALLLKEKKLNIYIDGEKIKRESDVPWSYPQTFEPQRLKETLTLEGEDVAVNLVAGLALESRDDYGLTVYCNGRRIVTGKRDYYSGFVTGHAGKPHPDIALTRLVLTLTGPAKLMPWTSAKTDVNPGHPTYQAIQGSIHKLANQYAKVSRALAGQFSTKVAPFKEGKIKQVSTEHAITEAKARVLKPPRTKYHQEEKIERKNRKLAESKVWVTGLYEAVAAVDIIRKKKSLSQRNRFALILLDSTIEIACKEYLAFEKKVVKNTKQLEKRCPGRAALQEETRKASKTPKYLWEKIDYFYQKRCALVHETAGFDPSDDQVEKLESVVKILLHRLFKIEF